MNRDQKFLIALWFIIGCVICSVAWAIAWGTTITGREAVRNGLVEVEYQGTVYNETKWGKR